MKPTTDRSSGRRIKRKEQLIHNFILLHTFHIPKHAFYSMTTDDNLFTYNLNFLPPIILTHNEDLKSYKCMESTI